MDNLEGNCFTQLLCGLYVKPWGINAYFRS